MLITKQSSLCSKTLNPQRGGFCHLSLYISEDWIQTKTHHAGSVKAPDTIKISGRFCQQLNKTNKILNIFLVRNHAQRDNITTHEYRKCALMTFLLTTYKNALIQVRV